MDLFRRQTAILPSLKDEPEQEVMQYLCAFSCWKIPTKGYPLRIITSQFEKLMRWTRQSALESPIWNRCPGFHLERELRDPVYLRQQNRKTAPLCSYWYPDGTKHKLTQLKHRIHWYVLTIVIRVVKRLQNEIVVSRPKIMSSFQQAFKGNSIDFLGKAFDDVISILSFLKRFLPFSLPGDFWLLSSLWTRRQCTRKHHL